MLRPLGRGGMGAVYLGEATSGERVALKAMAAAAAASPSARRRFEEEARALRRLDHPRVVRVLGEVEEDGDTVFYAMEFLAGLDLGQHLRQRGALPLPQALGILDQILDGLSAAHRKGIVHRDVKPSNVLIERATGRIVVTDFGLARLADRSRFTATGAFLGTPTYVAPEQADGEDATAASDVYAVGVLAFEVLTGRPPFEAETPLALLRMHVERPPPALGERLGGAPAGLCSWVARALEKSPAARFADAAAMRAALRSFAETAGISLAERVLVGGEDADGGGAQRERPGEEALFDSAAEADTVTPNERVAARRAEEGETDRVAARASPLSMRGRRVGFGLAAALGVAGTIGLATWWTTRDRTAARVIDAAPSEGAGGAAPSERPADALPSPSSGSVVITLRDGGPPVAGRLLGIEDGFVRVEIADGAERRIPMDTVEAIEHRP